MSELKLTVIDRDGQTHQVAAETGEVLMHVLRDHVDITLGTCGGEISCGTCLVRLSAEWAGGIAVAGEDEAEMLEALGAEGNARLSCQIRLDSAADNMQATLLHEE